MLVIEPFRTVEDITGKKMTRHYIDQNRINDHICYASADPGQLMRLERNVAEMQRYH